VLLLGRQAPAGGGSLTSLAENLDELTEALIGGTRDCAQKASQTSCRFSGSRRGS
jgi:hypothetical protein